MRMIRKSEDLPGKRSHFLDKMWIGIYLEEERDIPDQF